MIIKRVPSFYSQVQLEQYLAKIGYPTAAAAELDVNATPLDKLRLLIRLHLVGFPWSNTEIHYTKNHHVEVSPEGVFELLVRDGTKTTFCFGHDTLFLGMLRAIGYRVYPGSGRVIIGYPVELLPSRLTHMVLFIQPFEGSRSEETYIVDVGLGSSSLCEPLLLSDDANNVVMGTTTTEKHRLRRTVVPGSAVADRQVWEVQQWRSNAPDEWVGLYVFSEEEYHLCDFSAASFFVSNIPNQVGRMQNNIMVIRSYFLDPSKPKIGGEIGKDLLFDDTLKRTEGNKSEVIKTFSSEGERINSIREVFGIILNEDAEEVIKASVAALKVNQPS